MSGLGRTVVGVGAGFIAAQASIEGVQKIMSASIGSAMKFEHQMAQIRGLTGATKEDTDLLEGSIKDMARAMPKSPEELGAGAYFIISAGITDAAEAADVLEISAKASAAGLGETRVVADAVTSALNAYKLEASDAGKITDILTTTVRLGKTEASALAGSIGRILPVAAAMGVTFEEVGANLAVMTKVGLSADEAATSLRSVLTSLLNPAQDSADAMAEMGLSAEQVRKSIREDGLLATLDDLMTRTGGNMETIGRLIPNVRALTNVLGTVGSQGETYAETLRQMNNASGATEAAFKEVADTAQFKMQQALSEVNLVLMELGQEVLPAIVPAMKLVADGAVIMVRAIEGIIAPIEYLADAVDMAFGKMPPIIDLQKQKLVELAGSARITRDEFIKAAEGIGMTTRQAKRFADETSFPTQLEVARRELEKLGWSTDEVNSYLEKLTPWVDGASDAMIEFKVAAGETEGSSRRAAEGILTMAGALEQLETTLGGLGSIRTEEANALDQQIVALRQEQVAAEMAEVGQDRLGVSTAKATNAFEAQLKPLQVTRLELEKQIGAHTRLAALKLEEARVKNLPTLAKVKDLEVEREKILQKVGGETDRLSDKERRRLDHIERAIEKGERQMRIVTLEAEAENIAAEAKDRHRRSLEKQLWRLQDQIAAVDTERQKVDLMTESTGGAVGATKTLSEKIGENIRKLQLQREAQDLTIEGFRLQKEAMERLPKMEDIGQWMKQYKMLLLFDLHRQLAAAIGGLEWVKVPALVQQIGQVASIKVAQHGFHGYTTQPTMFMTSEGGQRERVDITPGGKALPAGQPIQFIFNGPVLGDHRQAQAMAEWLIPEIRRALA